MSLIEPGKHGKRLDLSNSESLSTRKKGDESPGTARQHREKHSSDRKRANSDGEEEGSKGVDSLAPMRELHKRKSTAMIKEKKEEEGPEEEERNELRELRAQIMKLKARCRHAERNAKKYERQLKAQNARVLRYRAELRRLESDFSSSDEDEKEGELFGNTDLTAGLPCFYVTRVTPKKARKNRVVVIRDAGIRVVKPHSEVLVEDFEWRKVKEWTISEQDKLFKFTAEDPLTQQFQENVYSCEAIKGLNRAIWTTVEKVAKLKGKTVMSPEQEKSKPPPSLSKRLSSFAFLTPRKKEDDPEAKQTKE